MYVDLYDYKYSTNCLHFAEYEISARHANSDLMQATFALVLSTKHYVNGIDDCYNAQYFRYGKETLVKQSETEQYEK